MKSTLDTATIGSLVSVGYGLGDVEGCTLIQSRNHDVYRVDVAARPYILKVFQRGLKKDVELRWERDLLRHLVTSGVRAPDVVVTGGGEPFLSLEAPEGFRLATLYTWVPGRAPHDGDPEVHRLAGRAVGHLYQVADGLRSPHQARTLDLDRVVRQGRSLLRRTLADRDDDLSYLLALLDEAHRRLTELITVGIDWGVCHGDVSFENMRVQDDGGVVLLDFENAGYAWRAADLCGFRHDLALNPDGWDAFAEGYQVHRPLGDRELTALDWMLVPFWLYNLRWLMKGPGAGAADDVSRAVRVLREWAQRRLH